MIGATKEELDSRIAQLKEELEFKDRALRICVGNVADLNDRIQMLIKTLESALTLTDAMLTALRGLPEPPPTSVIIAKANFDKSMKKLLGNEPINQSKGVK